MVEQGVSTRVMDEKNKEGSEVGQRRMVCGATGVMDMGQDKAAAKSYMRGCNSKTKKKSLLDGKLKKIPDSKMLLNIIVCA